MKQTHTIAPLYDGHSRVLILGSFPSVRSREARFFYGHPQNRFWQLLAQLLQCETPQDTEQKKAMLLRHHIALWDVIAECEIEGSADSSISGVRANDIRPILESAPIRQIFVNGRTAERLYRRHIEPLCGRQAVCLPSTSPANAACDMRMLREAWSQLLPYLRD